MDLRTYKKINREIFGFVRHLDVDPENLRPVHFFFYSDEEADAYRLAEELKQLDFKILEVTNCSSDMDQWLCLAEMLLVPEPGVMDRCTRLLLDLAERYDSLYDGWETRIDI